MTDWGPAFASPSLCEEGARRLPAAASPRLRRDGELSAPGLVTGGHDLAPAIR